MVRPALALLVAAAVLAGSTGCRDGGEGGDAPSATTDGADPDRPGLEAVLLDAGDLPAGFEPSAGADDTITSFCATHDAAAGLRARDRAVVAFARAGGGASVIQLAFVFEDGGAATFVAQAEEALAACSGVPDGSGTGLAFEYEPLSPAVAEVLAGAGDAATSGFGTSVGSGSFTMSVAVAHQGDVATLVAVLGLDEPREALDELAAATFAAAAERLAGADG